MTTALPPRQAHGVSLQSLAGDLFVTSFGYSASLLCAANEGELHWDGRAMREPKQLSPKQQRVVDEWMDHYDDYLAQP